MKSDNITVLSPNENVKEAFRTEINDAVDLILGSIKDESAFSGINPYELREKIRKLSFLPEKGEGWEGVLPSLRETIIPNMLRTWSSSYMPHLHSPALIESIAAELIISLGTMTMQMESSHREEASQISQPA